MPSRLELGSDGWPILLSDAPSEAESEELASRAVDEEVAARARARVAARQSTYESSGDEDFDRLVTEERMELVADVIADLQLGGPRQRVKIKTPRGFVRNYVSSLDDDSREKLMFRLRHRGLSEQDAAIAANV